MLWMLGARVPNATMSRPVVTDAWARSLREITDMPPPRPDDVLTCSSEGPHSRASTEVAKVPRPRDPTGGCRRGCRRGVGGGAVTPAVPSCYRRAASPAGAEGGSMVTDGGRSVPDDQDRWKVLLDGVVTMAADLTLDDLLQRIVEVAADLANARYAALGVIAAGGGRASAASRRSSRTDSPRSSGRRWEEPPARARPPRPAHRPSRAGPPARDRRPPGVVRLPGAPPADGLVPRGAGPDRRRYSATST